jgi:RTX calcium-binding nonapeptide repeat (4 copies)
VTHSAKRPSLAGLLLLGSVAGSLLVGAPQVSGQEPPQCLGAPATIIGDADATPGDGTISGTPGNDIIVGTEGDDVIAADAGDDRVCGMGGADKITGGDGFDRANGGPGDDACETERTVNCEPDAATPAPAPSPEPQPAPPPGS